MLPDSRSCRACWIALTAPWHSFSEGGTAFLKADTPSIGRFDVLGRIPSTNICALRYADGEKAFGGVAQQ